MFNNAYVHDPELNAFQDRITAIEDSSRKTDSAEVTVHLHDGRALVCNIKHGIGGAGNPMTDAQLETKFTDQCRDVVGAERCVRLVAACRGLDKLADAGSIARDAI